MLPAAIALLIQEGDIMNSVIKRCTRCVLPETSTQIKAPLKSFKLQRANVISGPLESYSHLPHIGYGCMTEVMEFDSWMERL
jgi:hypothetical protein